MISNPAFSGTDKMAEEIIEWEAPEFHKKKKSREWYWALFIIAAGLIGFAMIFRNGLFIVIIILAVFIIFANTGRSPRNIHYALMSKGIRAGNTFYPYVNLDAFWVHEEDQPEIIVRSSKTLMPHISIPLNGTSPEGVRKYLLNHLNEEPQEKGLLETFAEYLGL